MPEQSDRKHRILYVEDDGFMHLTYKYWLEDAGFEVIVIEDGSEALEKAKEFLPDLVLLDLVMFPKDGFEVMSELNRDPATANIPVCIFSNLKQERTRRCEIYRKTNGRQRQGYRRNKILPRIINQE